MKLGENVASFLAIDIFMAEYEYDMSSPDEQLNVAGYFSDSRWQVFSALLLFVLCDWDVPGLVREAKHCTLAERPSDARDRARRAAPSVVLV